MSRKRNHIFVDKSLSPDPQNIYMDTPGQAVRADDDFLDFEPDEELLCSVSDITEHLGRNITVVLETALSEIRKMVTVRIRVLKMELREKTEEIEILKTRLETVHKEGRDPFSGAMTGEASSVFRKADLNSGSKHNSSDPKKAKPIPGVKKENINAICDYLMKDKNSRGGAEMDSDPSNPPSGSDTRHDPESHSLNLWSESGLPVAGPEPGDGESDSATDDIFGMLPSSSKRIYDYEWMAGVDYPSDLKGLREPKCESAATAHDVDGETDDSKGEGDMPDQDHSQRSLSHVQTPEFPLEPQGSPGEGGGDSSMEDHGHRLEPVSDSEFEEEDETGPQPAPEPARLQPDPARQQPAPEPARQQQVAGPASGNKRKRCDVCGPKKDRKTQHTCIKCKKYICNTHTVKLCLSCFV